jgi:hypothetical protein
MDVINDDYQSIMESCIMEVTIIIMDNNHNTHTWMDKLFISV